MSNLNFSKFGRNFNVNEPEPKPTFKPKPKPKDPFDDSVNPPKGIPVPTPTPTPTDPVPNVRPTAPSLAGITTYDTPEESISSYAKWLKGQQAQSKALAAAAIESGDYSGLEDVDINAINRDPIRFLK